MIQAGTPIRELIPERRISCAMIRSVIAGDALLGEWSREARGGIRPQRLALLVRRSIWRAHDIRYGDVREQFRKNPAKPVEFPVEVEIYAEGAWRHLTSCTTFTLRPSGRITAEIDLCVGNRSGKPAPIARSCILLRPAGRSG